MKVTLSFVGIVALAVVLAAPASVVLAQAPGQADLQADPYYADYVSTMAYWFESVGGNDWQAKLAEALVVAPDQSLEQYDEDDVADEEPSWVRTDSRVRAGRSTGLPSSSWWIDTWRQDLDGSWTKVLRASV